MRNKARWIVLAVGLLLSPAYAHHSFNAEFDGSRTISVRGVISRIQWINPHVYVYVMSQGEKGEPETWSFETLPTGYLHSMGITEKLLQGQPGETVTVVANPARDGTKALGWIITIAYPDGHVYTMTPKVSLKE
jgi:hypothetical protein